MDVVQLMPPGLGLFFRATTSPAFAVSLVQRDWTPLFSVNMKKTSTVKVSIACAAGSPPFVL